MRATLLLLCLGLSLLATPARGQTPTIAMAPHAGQGGQGGQGLVPGQQATAWRIAIREAAVVASDIVTLGDIAAPMGPVEPETWSRLAVVPLFQSPPKAGKPMAIQPQNLKAILDQTLGPDAFRCLLPRRFVVQRGGAMVDEDAVRKLVVDKLTAFCAALPGEKEFRDIKGPEFLFLEDAANRLDVLPGQDACAPGRLNYRIQEIAMDNSVARAISGGAFLDVWVNVPVAARPLSKGEAVTPDMISHARKNLAYVKGEVFEMRGGPWRMVRGVGTGQPIAAADVQALPAVVKGASLEMLFEGKHVTLRVPAMAMADGAIGERILVRNVMSNKEVHATVRDAKTVTVQ